MTKIFYGMLVAGMCMGVSARAEESADVLTDIRRQAHAEHVKEEEIQMMRLELEKLKIEAEMRKTRAAMGAAGASVPAVSSPLSVELRNIVLTGKGARAEVDIGGARQLVSEGDKAGSVTIKKINANDIVFLDAQGQEGRAEVRR
jgi:type II secretory pathway component PulC